MIKYLVALLFTINLSALDLELAGGFTYDNGSNTPSHYEGGNKVMGDIALYLVQPLNKEVELLCGIYHASNPEEADGRTGADVTGIRCGVRATLIRGIFE